MEFYLTQILFFGAPFAPKNFQFCAGQIIGIAQNTALFSLLGTNFGGNGQTTFGLPDARGRTFLGVGQGPGLTDRVLGEVGGVETNTLTTADIPPHTHTLAPGTASLAALAGVAASEELSEPEPNAQFGTAISTSGGTVVIYVPAGTAGTSVPLGGVSLQGGTGITGSGIPVNNMQPFLVVNAIICTQGIFPSRN